MQMASKKKAVGPNWISTWRLKGFDFEVMDRLFEKGYILDPRGKSKSVVLTEEGLARSERLFGELFGKR